MLDGRLSEKNTERERERERKRVEKERWKEKDQRYFRTYLGQGDSMAELEKEVKIQVQNKPF